MRKRIVSALVALVMSGFLIGAGQGNATADMALTADLTHLHLPYN